MEITQDEGLASMSDEDRKPIPRLFDITIPYDRLVLTVSDELNDVRWGAWFGEIQSVLRDREFNDIPFNECWVNFKQCCWADPLPLLSLAQALAEFEHDGGQVRIFFPTIPNSDKLKSLTALASCRLTKSNDQKDNEIKQARFSIKQARFLRFLALEGFITLLSEPNIINLPNHCVQLISKKRTARFGEEQFSNTGLALLKDLQVSMAFERSTCLLATLLNLQCPANKEDTASLDAIDDWVAKVLFQSIDQSVYDEVPSWAQDGLRYRLLTFLRETLHNVAEHAYDGHQRGLAAVYVRYREGALGEAPPTWGRLEEFLKRESVQHQVPLMGAQHKQWSFPYIRSGFFEVFVLDAGQGLCRSLGTSSSKDGGDSVHPTMLSVFDEKWNKGSSSKGDDRPTRRGGLYLVSELFTPNEDYFRARDEDTWWGTQLPLKKTGAGSQPWETIAVNAYGKECGNDGIKGLAWTARVSWLEAQDMPGGKGKGIWKEIDDKSAEDAVFSEGEKQSINYPAILVHDSRFQSYFFSNIPGASPRSDDQVLLLLPEPRWMKNHIQDKLGGVLEQLDGISDLSLIFGDIPSEEAVTYLAAIAGASRLQSEPFNAVKRVILVTRELKVCVLQRDAKDLFKVAPKATVAFSRSDLALSELAPHQSLIDYLRVLRTHDGHRLQEIVTKPLSDSPYADFLCEKVDWHNDLTLNGYLDFPQTLTHPLCRSIYSISLQRLNGLFPRHDCQLIALDPLVDSLVTRFNAQTHPRPSSKQMRREPQSIHIGSVKVSGHTEQAGKLPDTPVFHFFRHPDSKRTDGCFLLPWIGPSEINSQNTDSTRFRRVGQTSVIARDGWKAYPLPRFDKQHNPIYEQTPRDSYRAWQEPSRTPMKLGHWSYGGHHEILTINLLLAFDTELDRISLVLEGGSLARFTYANLFCALGVTQEHLNEQGRKLLAIVGNDNYRHLLPPGLWDRKPLLVYPSHAVTDHIIDRFLGLFLPEYMEAVRSRLIAILPVRRHRSGSGLQVSGITLERLRSFVPPEKETDQPEPPPPVIYFDDAVISGRTYEEIKRLLRDMGYRDIYSLVLLDRQRLPSADHMKREKHVGYWRLDVPSMGGKAHCPLCHARDLVQSLSDSIVSPTHRERIASWLQTWEARDTSTQWGGAGLRPIPLTLSKAERKFGVIRNSDGSYSQIGGEKQQIRLTNSAGLIAWMTELHSITSRDDLPLAILKRETLSSEVRIQLLASQLLLFFAEFDGGHARNLATHLLEALWDSTSHDRHTALAVLTLVSCGNDILIAVVKQFFTPVDSRLDQFKDRNLDLVLLLALVFATEKGELKQLREDPLVDVAMRLLKPCGKPNLYYRLHREIKDALGKAHSSPLHRLVDVAEDVTVLTKEQSMNMLGSAAQVRVITKSILWHWLRSETEAHKVFAQITYDVESCEAKLCEAIEQLWQVPMSGRDHQEQFKQAKKRGKELLKYGDKLHAGLFAPIGIQSMKQGRPTEFLQEIKKLRAEFDSDDDSGKRVIKWSEPGQNESKVLVSKIKKAEINEAFVVWDAEIKEAVQDMLSNARHSPAIEIKDPWDKKGNNDVTAHCWCRISMSPNMVHIEMKNKSEKKKEQFEEDVRRSHGYHVIRETGGEVSYNETPRDGLLLTTVSLPFAHTLQIQHEGNINE